MSKYEEQTHSVSRVLGTVLSSLHILHSLILTPLQGGDCYYHTVDRVKV